MKLIQSAGKGFDIDVRNRDDKTPLMLAARVGKQNSIQILVDHSADVNAMNRKTGWSVLHEAAFSGNTEVVRLLLARGARITEATWVYNKQKEPDSEYYEEPEWVNHRQYNKYPQPTYECGRCGPLIPACLRGNPELLELLIKTGDDPHQVLSDGTNALHYSAAINPELCRWLLKDLHVNPNAGKRETPIHYVKDVSLLPCFLECGASLESVDRNGESFLYAHCGKKGNPEMAIFALQHGADLKNVPPNQIANLASGMCLPLKHFEDGLITRESEEWTSYNERTTTYKIRMISPKLVEAVLRAFMARGVKLSKTIMCAPISNYNWGIHAWLKKSGQSSQSLLELLKSEDTCIIL